ncbi:hypothetical protein DFH08DRAFT_814858 [Mycena albidolilacea]|uniref:Uncharacterized protein n=1 Tax=Mycena albidolilacea TaxID=1033008 RepID=A0AAD6ZPC1_9AGAR|nr:hypothetical protein DFH08DRAFT_814858 [Mycena albidolilacea]
MPAQPPFLYFRRKLPFTQKFLPAAGLVLPLDTRLSCPLEAILLQATEFLGSLPTVQGRNNFKLLPVTSSYFKLLASNLARQVRSMRSDKVTYAIRWHQIPPSGLAYLANLEAMLDPILLEMDKAYGMEQAVGGRRKRAARRERATQNHVPRNVSRSAHRGKSPVPKDAANQIPLLVKGQRRIIRNSQERFQNFLYPPITVSFGSPEPLKIF